MSRYCRRRQIMCLSAVVERRVYASNHFTIALDTSQSLSSIKNSTALLGPLHSPLTLPSRQPRKTRSIQSPDNSADNAAWPRWNERIRNLDVAGWLDCIWKREVHARCRSHHACVSMPNLAFRQPKVRPTPRCSSAPSYNAYHKGRDRRNGRSRVAFS